MQYLADFFVPGLPRPAGSKSAFPYVREVLRVPHNPLVTIDAVKRYLRDAVRFGVTVADDSKHLKQWQKDVRRYAACLNLPTPEKGQNLAVWMEFRLERPKGHFRAKSKGGLHSWAPLYPNVMPDVLKLARAVEDALTGIVWHDDAEIVDEHISKCYAPVPGVAVKVVHLFNSAVEVQKQLSTCCAGPGMLAGANSLASKENLPGDQPAKSKPIYRDPAEWSEPHKRQLFGG